MENAVDIGTFSYDAHGSLIINKKGTRITIEYCPFCGTIQDKSNTDKLKDWVFALIGIGLIISGGDSIVRTWCLNVNDSLHPALRHACLVYTAVPSYIAGGIIILAGLVIFFWDRVLVWWAGTEVK